MPIIISLFLSLLFSTYPPKIYAPVESSFECDGKSLEATIYNNQNGDFAIVNPNELIDAGGFVVLNWNGKELMLPRSFNANEASFTDGKWWWGYAEPNPPLLRHRESKGEIKDFSCRINSE